jgi:O-antigen ligase
VREKAEAVLGKVLVWALVSVTLLVTPLLALDPINPIKMLAVSATSFMGFGVVLANQKALSLGRFKVPLIFISSFMGWQLVVLVVSGGEKLQQLFGTTGRNTGLITYLAFSILFVVSLAASNTAFLNRFLLASLAVGVASLGYGVVQALGRDPFDWVNPYSPVFGFLGNPNFQSSLLGILGSVVFTQLLSGAVKLQVKGGYLVYLVVTLYVIKETDSQQGFLVLIIGSGIALGVYVNQKSRALGYSYLGLALICFFAVLVGTLNKGPLASLLYKDSVSYRGDYWRAGWKMTVDNPIFGVGLDTYGDWYRRSRTIEATLRRGPDVTSNAAHNVFLDISAYGGFPLMLIYIALVVLVMISAVKVIKRSHGFNAGFVGLLAGWVAFQAQSIISINQIGLALWGWVLSGLIIGYEINTRDGEVVVEKRTGKNTVKPTMQSSAGSVMGMFVGLIIGVLVGIPPYLASAKYKSALETSNPTVIQEAAYIWPLDSSRMIQVSMTLNENKLEAQGLEVALDAIKSFPNNYGAWRTLSLMKNASEEQKVEALAQMKRLDPLNPDLK